MLDSRRCRTIVDVGAIGRKGNHVGAYSRMVTEASSLLSSNMLRIAALKQTGSCTARPREHKVLARDLPAGSFGLGSFIRDECSTYF